MPKIHFPVIYELILTFIGVYNPINYIGNYLDFLNQKVEFSNGFKKISISYKDIEFFEVASKYTLQIFFNEKVTKRFKDFTFGLGTGNALFISSRRINDIAKIFEQKKVKRLKG